jgi:hypothetical protein
MFAAIRRRVGEARAIEFCEQCGQVCTSTCRAETRRERVSTELAAQLPFPR